MSRFIFLLPLLSLPALAWALLPMNSTQWTILGTALFFVGAIQILLSKGRPKGMASVSQILSDTAESITKAAVAANSQSKELSQLLEIQNRELAKSSSASHEIQQTLETGLQQTQNAADNATKTLEAAKTGQGLMHDTNKALEAIAESNQNVRQCFEWTNKEISQFAEIMNEVSSKTEIINDIVFQTKLLSFNASVEASRAGEHGKGFSVVAEEIAQLAEKSGSASVAISEIVSRSLEKIRHVVDDSKSRIEKSLAESDEVSQSGLHSVKMTTDHFDNIFSLLKQLSDNIDEVVQASQDQSIGVQESLKSIIEIESASNKVASISAKQVQSSELLNSESEKLNQCMSDLWGYSTGSWIKEVGPTEALRHLKSYHEIIDVRRQDEYFGDLGHIAGSKLVPLNDNLAHDLKDFDKSKSYLFVCRSGGRSSKAARIAQKAGFKKITNMTGGMLRWNEEALPTEGSNRPVMVLGI